MPSSLRNLNNRKYYLDKEKRIPLPAHVKSNVQLNISGFQPFKLLAVFCGILVIITFLKWQLLSITQNVQNEAMKTQRLKAPYLLKQNNQNNLRAENGRELIGFEEISFDNQQNVQNAQHVEYSSQAIQIEDSQIVSQNHAQDDSNVAENSQQKSFENKFNWLSDNQKNQQQLLNENLSKQDLINNNDLLKNQNHFQKNDDQVVQENSQQFVGNSDQIGQEKYQFVQNSQENNQVNAQFDNQIIQVSDKFQQNELQQTAQKNNQYVKTENQIDQQNNQIIDPNGQHNNQILQNDQKLAVDQNDQNQNFNFNFDETKKLNVVTQTSLYNKLHGIPEEKIIEDGLAFHEIERWKKFMPQFSEQISFIPGDGSGNYLHKPAIVLFCYNRPEYLQKTLESLSQQIGLEDFSIYVSQDGDDEEVADVAKKSGENFFSPPITKKFEHWQHPRLPLLGNKQPGHAWLAQHYKWALDRAFLQKNHSHVIIIEDDMLFSPDFLNLFKSTAILLEIDPTIWCVSSWNDNGVANFDWRPDKFLRTSFFPGLGWMTTQKIWNEIGPSWPLENWDHWMRLETINLGRQCIAPEVNRNFNIGEKGANMNKKMYKQYLQKMIYYQNLPISDFGDLSYLLKPNYEKTIQEKIKQSVVIRYQGQTSLPPETTPQTYLILYQIEQYKQMTKQLFIWPFPRGHYNHISILTRKSGQILLLADIRLCPLLDDKLRIFPTPSLFAVAGGREQDCQETCQREGGTCSLTDFQFINSCMQLQQKFPCERGCGLVLGPDVPNYVMSEELDTNRLCLVNEAAYKCTGKHPATARLCPCIK